jgi:helix-turn-helix protein
MSESVIADFLGTFNAEISPDGEPVRGRIVCSQKRLVLAADSDHSLHIPLSSIFDIAIGHVPPELGEFFESTVTVAFERDDRRRVAAVEASDDHVRKFATVLFKAILNGTEVTVRSPARRGGRVTDEPFVATRLSLEPQTVWLRSGGEDVSIELGSVTNFDRDKRVVGGRERPVLVVDHMAGGQTLTTLAATRSARKLSLLGRYLRMEYADLVSDIQDVELTEDKTEVLVALYSGANAPGVSLANVLDMDASELTMLLNDLAADDLVEDTESGTELTPKGRVVATNHLEDVDA